MSELDVAQIVPSTRDLLQVLATRRKSLALVGELGEGRAAEEAARLHEVNVSAFAFAAPSSAMTDGARATKTVPSLSLAPVATREDIQRARFFGADGVCIDVALPPTEWDALAKIARGMRMLPLGLVRTTADVELAAKAGPRALVRGRQTVGGRLITVDQHHALQQCVQVGQAQRGELRRAAGCIGTGEGNQQMHGGIVRDATIRACACSDSHLRPFARDAAAL